MLEMFKRLDTDKANSMGFNDEFLRSLAKNPGWEVKDDDGKKHTVSPELSKAAQTILNNGGTSSINPGGEQFSMEHLQRSIDSDPAPLHHSGLKPVQPGEPVQPSEPGRPAESGEIRN